MNKSVAVRSPQRVPAKKPRAAVANLGDMVTALLDRPEVDNDMLDRAERLLNLHRQQLYAADMVACQEEIPLVLKNRRNTQTNSSYATFEALDRAIRPTYTAHGFALSFGTTDCPYPDRIRVTCDITHRSGMVKVVFVDMPIDGKGAKGNDVMTKTHATMSGLSYAKRGLEAMIFNVITTDDAIHDDDGNAAGGADLIDEDEQTSIRAMLEAASIPEEKFLRWAKVESIAAIPSKFYDQAVAEIARVAKEKAAKANA
jgi:hypothetical protein